MTKHGEALNANPSQLLEEAIKTYVRESPQNSLKEIDSSPIYEEPLVGFADGDDPLFLEYKTIIGDFHLAPREALERHLREELNREAPQGGDASVISFILPIAKAARLSNRRMTNGPSLRWNHVRWHGQFLAEELASYVVSLLRGLGFQAVAPAQAPFFQLFDQLNGGTSNWSQRHIAYVAGLGTFGLSDAFITPKGVAIRCGSVVTNLKLRPTPRTYSSYVANCRFFADGSCGACVERCPAGAISPQGHDKIKCREELLVAQKRWLEKPGYIGKYAGCGLCLTKVPCEAGIPTRASRRSLSQGR